MTSLEGWVRLPCKQPDALTASLFQLQAPQQSSQAASPAHGGHDAVQQLGPVQYRLYSTLPREGFAEGRRSHIYPQAAHASLQAALFPETTDHLTQSTIPRLPQATARHIPVHSEHLSSIAGEEATGIIPGNLPGSYWQYDPDSGRWSLCIPNRPACMRDFTTTVDSAESARRYNAMTRVVDVRPLQSPRQCLPAGSTHPDQPLIPTGREEMTIEWDGWVSNKIGGALPNAELIASTRPKKKVAFQMAIDDGDSIMRANKSEIAGNKPRQQPKLKLSLKQPEREQPRRQQPKSKPKPKAPYVMPNIMPNIVRNHLAGVITGLRRSPATFLMTPHRLMSLFHFLSAKRSQSKETEETVQGFLDYCYNGDMYETRALKDITLYVAWITEKILAHPQLLEGDMFLVGLTKALRNIEVGMEVWTQDATTMH